MIVHLRRRQVQYNGVCQEQIVLLQFKAPLTLIIDL